jgi:DNA polymerase-1
MYIDQTMPDYSRKRWEQIVREYYEKYEVLAQWQASNINKVYKNGGILQMLSGRIFAFPEQSQGSKDKYSPTQIKNYPVQGTAADVMALAMVTIRRKMRRDNLLSLVIGQVHDALVFDGPQEEVKQLEQICLETFRDLPRLLSIFWNCDWNVPLDGDVESGPSYGETYKLAA